MYRTIMVPLDGSSFGEYALPLALGIARRAEARIELVHACRPPALDFLNGGAPAVQPPTPERERVASYLSQLAECLSERWDVSIGTAVLEGPAADALYSHALAAGIDLVVMTTHGYGPLSRVWMGSVADKLMRRLPMPALLVRPHEQALDMLEGVHEQAFEHVLIPLDGSALSEEILEPATVLGEPMGAEYTLIQAIDPPMLGYAPAAQVAGVDEQVLEQWRAEAQAYLERVAGRMRARGLLVRTSVLYAPPAVAILDYAREHAVDLIAMSTHGRGGVARMLLGSVADKVVRGAGCPVLIQPPHGESAHLTASAKYAAEDSDR